MKLSTAEGTLVDFWIDNPSDFRSKASIIAEEQGLTIDKVKVFASGEGGQILWPDLVTNRAYLAEAATIVRVEGQNMPYRGRPRGASTYCSAASAQAGM